MTQTPNSYNVSVWSVRRSNQRNPRRKRAQKSTQHHGRYIAVEIIGAVLQDSSGSCSIVL